ncbi:hypothetical protein [Hoyosella altamirensis]|uniref:Uncharacterized protein n=1 Tax=Hoyosella altamirensis TaxID=616997 RepID=A0A839RPT2_9ACTN|nr:hypothetical protein [Hoyosella altamirensis]MBB3038540.1 hypothetical protein [Hoyosella altamirensis]
MGGDPTIAAETEGTQARPRSMRLERFLAVALLTPQQAALLLDDLISHVERANRERLHAQAPAALPERAVRIAADGTLDFSGTQLSRRSRDEPSPRTTVLPAAQRSGAYAGSPAPIRAPINGTVATTDAGTMKPAQKCELDIAALQLACSILSRTRRASALTDVVAAAVRTGGDTGEASRCLVTFVESELRVADETRLRSELAAVVRAAQGHSQSASPQPAAVLAPRGRRSRTGKVWHRTIRLPSRRFVLLTLLVAAVLVAGLLLIPRVVSDLRATWDTVMNPDPPAQQLEPVSPPFDRGGGLPPGPIPELAPPAGGSVEQVTASFADGGCQQAQTCSVRVDLRFEPDSDVSLSSWILHVADRCSGEIVEHPGVAMPVPPNSRQVYGLSQVMLPDSPAVALTAVTYAPDRVASAPLLVPADGGSC